ncbi:hypothetical protein BJV78DRAFT_327636 [Lactifluus subvellereus]|nr:hypothetical protein BJV78DRAFT_327636 [Lactifluus subvellereus]
MQGTTVLLSTIWTLFFASHFNHVVAASTEAFLPQGFFFDWNPPGTSVPIPTTQQCETLHITWSRTSAGSGRDPVSPYHLQIFTSTFIFPFVVPAGNGPTFDFQVPWIPGTQYQICMWDSNGVSGGCQGMYTVIPNASTQNPTCQNVTYPAAPLGVDAAVNTGAFSQYGWPPQAGLQCTDIQVQGKNGTPPYTLTVAPALHPPVVIQSNNGDPINWTVSLSHGSPFFIAVTDSQGVGWSQGPLHSGDNAETRCLDINNSGRSSSHVGQTIGAALGGIVVGLIAGAAGIFVFRRCRGGQNRRSEVREDLIRDSHHGSGHFHSREVGSIRATPNPTGGTGLEYIVEPFAMPSPGNSDPTVPLLPSGTPTSPPASSPDATSAAGSDPVRQNVYVVHHDGGRAPVTVYTEAGAEVVELPPRYADSGSATSDGQSQRREGGSGPRKGRGPRPT